MAASVYMVQKDYTKAETYLVRALSIEESLFGRDGINIRMPLFNVCILYDEWGKPDKLELCDRQPLAVLEKTIRRKQPSACQHFDQRSASSRHVGTAPRS